MELNSFYFLLFLAVMFFIYPIGKGVGWRHCVIALANAVFCATYLGNVMSLIALLVIVLAGYLAAYAANKTRRLGPGIILYLALSIIVFVIVKKYEILEYIYLKSVLMHAVFIIGYSYMLFKQIHVIIDASSGTITGLSPFVYFNYLLGFYTLLAGPIQRYNDFAKQWSGLGTVSWESREVLKNFNRLVNGFIKAFVIAPLVGAFCGSAALAEFTAGEHSHPVILFLIMVYACPVFVYLNFSGYCDIMISCARLLGIAIPENFDHPYKARNMIDFWNRWHISLSEWLRDYVFNPSYKALATRWFEYRSIIVLICYMVTMVISGVWHGTTISFVFFGALHGVGVYAAKLWEDIIKWKYGKSGLKKYRANYAVSLFARFVTLNYTAMTFLFFMYSLKELNGLWEYFWR